MALLGLWHRAGSAVPRKIGVRANCRNEADGTADRFEVSAPRLDGPSPRNSDYFDLSTRGSEVDAVALEPPSKAGSHEEVAVTTLRPDGTGDRDSSKLPCSFT